MGGEKFFNIKSYYSGLKPERMQVIVLCCVCVCVLRAKLMKLGSLLCWQRPHPLPILCRIDVRSQSLRFDGSTPVRSIGSAFRLGTKVANSDRHQALGQVQPLMAGRFRLERERERWARASGWAEAWSRLVCRPGPGVRSFC